MRVVFMGTPDFSVPALRAIAGSHEIAAVYTQPPRPAGRGQKERPSAVHRAADELDLPVRHPVSLRAAPEAADFAALDADVAVVVAYGLILPKTILTAPRSGCLNIHASLLPRWRGAAPIHRAIMAGDATTGISIMQMDEGLDTGPVLLERATAIGTEETTGELHDRLSAMGADLIVAALDRLGQLIPEPQGEAGVIYAHKIDKAEARIDWQAPADAVARLIRGLAPFPGAWCEIAGEERSERLKILGARPAKGSGLPGQILAPLIVACGSGAVEITRAQREGKRPMATADLLKGWSLPDRLD